MVRPPDKLYRIYGETTGAGLTRKGSYFVYAPNEVAARKLAEDRWLFFKIERIQEVKSND